MRWLEGSQLTAVEPHVRGVAGLHSPETAIADFAAVAREYADNVAAAGGQIRTGAGVARVHQNGRRPQVEPADGSLIEGDRVIVCAGLQADRLAMASGEPAEPRIVPFRGEYWQLRRERSHLVRGLIYPVPVPALPFLGVHMTRKIDGTVVLAVEAVAQIPGVGAEGTSGPQRRGVVDRDSAKVARETSAYGTFLEPALLAASVDCGATTTRRDLCITLDDLRQRERVAAVATVPLTPSGRTRSSPPPAMPTSAGVSIAGTFTTR